ncbi:hypothetical protein ACFX2G_041294 [Malus domestica]
MSSRKRWKSKGASFDSLLPAGMSWKKRWKAGPRVLREEDVIGLTVLGLGEKATWVGDKRERTAFGAEDEQIGDAPGTEQCEASISEVEDEAIRGVPGAKGMVLSWRSN